MRLRGTSAAQNCSQGLLVAAVAAPEAFRLPPSASAAPVAARRRRLLRLPVHDAPVVPLLQPLLLQRAVAAAAVPAVPRRPDLPEAASWCRRRADLWQDVAA